MALKKYPILYTKFTKYFKVKNLPKTPQTFDIKYEFIDLARANQMKDIKQGQKRPQLLSKKEKVKLLVNFIRR